MFLLQFKIKKRPSKIEFNSAYPRHHRILHTFLRFFAVAQIHRSIIHDHYNLAVFEIHIEMLMICSVVQSDGHVHCTRQSRASKCQPSKWIANYAQFSRINCLIAVYLCYCYILYCCSLWKCVQLVCAVRARNRSAKIEKKKTHRIKET